MPTSVLIADDDTEHLNLMSSVVQKEGYLIYCAVDGQQALSILRTETIDIVITDLEMAGTAGIEILRFAAAQTPPIPSIIVTGHEAAAFAVESLKLGAVDYISKPTNIENLLTALQRATERRKMLAGIGTSVPEEVTGFGGLIGDSIRMQEVFDQIRRCAPFKTTVLITGESGSGKELVARALHALSPCSNGPFIAVNCSAMPRELVESQLFGHEKGAFTGASNARKGVFEAANGGTLFLDEIGDLAPDAQAKLLRTLENRQVTRLGSTESINVNVRLLAATNAELKIAVEEHRFRDDLYYRLNVLHIALPPLRSRREDIPLLVRVFLDRFAHENGLHPKTITPETLTHMMAYDWPGNVRELKNMTERLAIISKTNTILPTDLPAEFQTQTAIENQPETSVFTFSGMPLEEMERILIHRTLEKTDGNRTRAAEILGISLRTLQRKLKEYGKN